ncbi:PREDICTED: uncharacterized protein LOC107354171 [Acropora digitifera]|uniref:uncharacterized protein LOC107354171 n=1 Tax=Acropora digitifera TaxID=70779 RepID=UPI00077A78A4|nr:PREDICTED: uncharacterized protein LOC107354171 [Acropora digitifera]XP_015776099.1 PREDICTED: uncharacterized protein LOC107354171 [Acropora digitifera]
MGDKWDDACNRVKLYSENVTGEQRNPNVKRSYADNILHPSIPDDLTSIRGFDSYTKNVREQFNKCMVDTPDNTAHEIHAEGESPVQPCLKSERKLHAAMSNGIAHLDSKGGSQNKAPEAEKLWFNCVHKYLKEKFKVSLLHAIEEVPLRGFAFTTDENSMPEFNFWDGKADAIGLREEKGVYKYVIVEWKKTGSTLNAFWEHGDVNMRSAHYRDHLTQCLVYARLLKMHLSLNYWPPILIVLFNSDKKYMHPRLFTDYPKESKRAIKKYQWSPNPPLRFKKGSPLRDTMPEGLLRGDMKLRDAFDRNATVDDLCKALKLCRVLVKD